MSLVFLGEAYGENEARISRSFVGAAGVELLRMSAEAGLLTLTSADREYINKFWSEGKPELLDCVWNLHPEVHRTNVFNQRPPGNKLDWFCGPKATALADFPALVKGKYVRGEFAHELERLADELCDLNPNLVVCLGNCALWAMAGTTGISKLRGTTLLSTKTATGFKLLPTYHPAAVLRQWELRPIAVMDLAKAKREAEFPEVRRPKREIWIEPSIEDMETFRDLYISKCSILSVDIETAGSQITCIGFAPAAGIALVVPFLDTSRGNRNYWHDRGDEERAWRIVRDILQSPIKKVFQNGLYDIAFLYRSCGIRVLGAEHDTMLLHHALQPESQKALDFLGSIYANEGAWKAEHKSKYKRKSLKRDE